MNQYNKILILLFLFFVILAIASVYLVPFTKYISTLFVLDIMGHYDCDTGNDWLTHIPEFTVELTRSIGIKVCQVIGGYAY